MKKDLDNVLRRYRLPVRMERCEGRSFLLTFRPDHRMFAQNAASVFGPLFSMLYTVAHNAKKYLPPKSHHDDLAHPIIESLTGIVLEMISLASNTIRMSLVSIASPLQRITDTML